MMRFFYICAFLAIMPVSQSMAADCAAATTVPVGNGKNGILVDKAWSGTSVIFDAVARKQNVYFGYYDADRWLTVAELDTKSNTLCRVRLNSRFAGWDSHNLIMLAFDADGHLQITGNMHDAPLVYGASETPDSISDLSLTKMVGKDEDSVTYPVFLKSADGKMFFSYRDGVSGDGTWLVNQFDGHKWHRVSNEPIFASGWNGRPTNAYPSVIRFSPDGFVHIAAVWRRNSDISSNYSLTYAKTRDFAHWFDHDMKPITPPLDPGNSDVIDAPGENKGLVNSARVNVMPNGRPLVVYSIYDAADKNAVVIATPSGKEWRRATIATSTHKITISSGGSIPNLPSFGDIGFVNESLAFIDVTFAGETKKRVFFEPETLNITSRPNIENNTSKKRTPAPPIVVAAPQGLTDVRKLARSVRIEGQDMKSAGSLIYFAQGLYHDQKRKCTPAEPHACDPPPSPLIFVENDTF